MPMSVSDLKAGEATVITVTRDALYVNAEEVVSLAQVVASTGPVVEPLRAVLEQQGVTANDERVVTVMAEKSLPYPVLRRIVASCAASTPARTHGQ
jgi:hypothetical protein